MVADNNTILELLKVDLGISGTAYDSRLTSLIEAAKESIKREGANLTDSAGDNQLVVMYAGWLWRNRDTQTGMPRMLRFQLNNRIFSEKMKV
mgnify:CR=1 FL=1